MTERERVINGLECCLPMTTRNGLANCKTCPYDRKITIEGGICECCHELQSDALALLKAQEPVKPKKVNRYIDFDGEGEPYTPDTFDCGHCKNELPHKASYCPNCGRAVKWVDG